VRFAFSDEQDQLRRQVRRALADAGGIAAARRAMLPPEGAGAGAGAADDGGGTDVALWRRLARDLGLAGLAVPEAHGGVGLGWVEIAAVIEELGAALACVPFLSSACLATAAILEAGTPAQHEALLPAMARGDVTATLAWLEVSGAASPDAIEATARPAPGDHVVLSGKKRFVLDGHTAELLLVAARAPDGTIALYAVPAGATGVRRRRLPTIDATRALAEVVLADVRVPASSRLGDGGWAPIARALARTRVALAVEQVGGAQACLDLGVEYAKVRQQFGRPIGSFQAIQHTLADLFVAVETARSIAYHAAWDCAQPGTDDAELELGSAAAAAYCADAFYRCAADTIQVHGGIGFTWEHDAHLYFKRARAGRTLLGSTTELRDQVARAIGLGSEDDAGEVR
jgi:alkylation response protein AidB-like acyl-CoA dehydrogenase